MSLVITNGTILLPQNHKIEEGTVVVEKGKIVKLLHKDEKFEALEGIRVIDATGLFVSPGFIDPHTHVSLFNDGESGANDANENTDPCTPYLRAIDGVFHEDGAFKSAVQAGVTCVAITPGSNNVVAGQVVALKTKPGNVTKKLVSECVAIKMSLGENPKRTYGPNKMPSTRMGIAYVLRKSLTEAQNFMYKLDTYEQEIMQPSSNAIALRKAKPDRNLTLEPMVDLLKRKYPAKIHCHRVDDIVTAVRICKEFNIDYTLDHCTEGHLLTDFLAEEKAKCIIGPIIAFRGKSELGSRSIDTASILHNAGVQVSLTTDHPVVPIDHFISQVHALTRAGFPLSAVLDCITLNPAIALRIDHRVGKIGVGMDADLLLLTAPPGDSYCHVVKTIIDGVVEWEKNIPDKNEKIPEVIPSFSHTEKFCCC